MNTVKINSYGHRYYPTSYLFSDENDKMICDAYCAIDILDNMKEEEQEIISLLVSRAYNAGMARKEKEFKNLIFKIFNLKDDD